MKLLEDMTEIRGLISLILVVTFCAITVIGKQVPTEMKDIMLMVIGFLFGSKLASDNKGGTNA